MPLEDTLKECSAGFSARLATDRRKSAQQMKEYLTGNTAPSLLSENTKKKSGYTWDHVFTAIHDLVLKETDKYESSKTFFTISAPLCTQLLHLCVSGSSKDNAYIECSRITDACIFILRDKRLTKAMGEAYLGLLHKNVFQYDHYLRLIKPATWENLYYACLSAFRSKDFTLDNFIKIRMLWLIMKNATKSCQFVIPLRDSLNRLEVMFEVMGDNKVQEYVIEIMIILLETVSTESRLKMCEFTENLLPLMFKLYDKNLEQKRKSSFFKMLHLTLMLHHPLGKKQNEKGSLAYNWATWNKHLHSIVEITSMEATYLQRPRKQDEAQSKRCSEYNSLAAAAYYQIFNLTEQSVEEENGSSSKKQKLNYNVNKSFNDLIEDFKQNHNPWLAIAVMYIKKYGRTVSKEEYLSLMRIVEALITNSNNNLDWDLIEDLACLILENLKHISDDSMFYDVKISLWNTCVRTSTLAHGHKALHTIKQFLLTLDVLKYPNVLPLFKLYFDKGMPVSDYSVETLNRLFNKFFSKCCNNEERRNIFSWLIHGQVTSVDVQIIQGLMLRLLAVENTSLPELAQTDSDQNLSDVLFNSIEQSILFSEFELEIPNNVDKPVASHKIEEVQLNIEMNEHIKKYLDAKLIDYTEQMKNQTIDFLECVKFNNIVLVYLDLMLQYNFVKRDELKDHQVYKTLLPALKVMYMSLTNKLRSNERTTEKKEIVQSLITMLVTDHDPLLSLEVRLHIDTEFLYCINNLITCIPATEDVEMFYGSNDSETPINHNALRHKCIYLLAAFCRRCGEYRSELLDLILDASLYNLSSSWDVDCAFECIELLIHASVEEPPLESTFTLMKNMCKDLVRNPDASFKILKILLQILDRIWVIDENMKKNSLIMIRSYLAQSEDLFYPPKVTAIAYECAAKLSLLNRLKKFTYLERLLEKLNEGIQTIRLYICYLLKYLLELALEDLDSHLKELLNIFVLKASTKDELILKDESANRTLTVLHFFFAMAQTKNSMIHYIVTQVMQIQVEKSMNIDLSMKVLNRITNMITNSSLDVYTNKNILYILYFWFTHNDKNGFENIPIQFFGFEVKDAFLERHMKWLVTADILWRNKGVIRNSEVLKQVIFKSGKSEEDIIKACICNILVLSLPCIVTVIYRPENYLRPKWGDHAVEMFNSTKSIFTDDTWTNLLVENMSELLLSIASHIGEEDVVKKEYHVDIPKLNKCYYYPKQVFSVILRHIQNIISEDLLSYLSLSQPLTIFNTLFKLWENILKENVFEYKVLALHSYTQFLEFVPLKKTSDQFVCNYVCLSFSHAIKDARTKKEIEVFIRALQSVLNYYVPDHMAVVQKSVSQILSILMIKTEEGFKKECASLLRYLLNSMKKIQDSKDVVDFFSSMSQGTVENGNCAKKSEFLDRLGGYEKRLVCPSHEVLQNMRMFLKQNKQFLDEICKEFNAKGFSDDCGKSIIHRIIYILSNTIKMASDDKTIIESCNCLADIGNYDLKTLVTVPPINTKRVTDTSPTAYFATVVLKSLSEILFDENPTVTDAVARALKDLLKYPEGKMALGLAEVNMKILSPFRTTENKAQAEFKINNAKFDVLCVGENWTVNRGERHSEWLMRLTVALLDVFVSTTNYTTVLRDVCISKPSVCRKILPPLMGVLLDCASEAHVKVIGDRVNYCFRQICSFNIDIKLENSDDITLSQKTSNVIDQDHKMIVLYMLDVVNFVRLQSVRYKLRKNNTLKALNFLELEYDKVAYAASVADQNLTVIYYGELWAMSVNGNVPPSSPEATMKLTGGENVQQVLRKSFVSIGEMDAIDGCGTAHLTSEEEKRKHLINTNQFSDALLLHDIALSCNSQDKHTLQYGVVKSLHKSGMHHLALQYIKSLPENDLMNNIKYECLSFLGDWSDFVDTRQLEEKSKQVNCNPHPIIKAFRYSCLKACLNINTSESEAKLVLPLNRAKLAVAKLCQNLNMENCQSVYKVLSKLHLFGDIEEYTAVRKNKLSLQDLLKSWRVAKLPACNDFKHLEALISQRSLILAQAAKEYGDSLRDIVPLQLQYVELGLSNQRVQMAQRMLAVVKKPQSSQEVVLAESRISWAKGHKDIALSLLRNIVSHPSSDVHLTAISLRQYGIWMAESKYDNPREIINKYLMKSLDVLNNNDHKETRLKVYYDIAKFADSEYKQVVSYMNSTIFATKVRCLENMKGTAANLNSTQQSLSRDDQKAMMTTNKFKEIEEAEIKNTEAEKKSFWNLAMRYYLRCLEQGEGNNLSVFRVISLWLDNPSLEFTDAEDSLEDLLHAIPSWKYVTVLPQLAPRLTNETSPFADNVRKIIKRCAVDHPHHTLPILFSLKNSNKDEAEATQQARPQEPRVVAAADLVHQLARETWLAGIVCQMEKMCDATISFANYDVPRAKELKRNTKQLIPSTQPIYRLGELNQIPVPTVTVPVNHNRQYSKLPTIHAYAIQNCFELVGGINFPKKIKCMSSDGVSRIMLIKGKDDLRQDAVMQQVFTIVNTLIENDPVTRRNNLLIRTYKVVPMSRRSGVLEWCVGTMPIGTYLVEDPRSSAHARYRPNDIPANSARQKLSHLYLRKASPEAKLKAFENILQQFKPVFHYFFTEHYLDPVTWYERRLAYTKSVATSSMVGYILGLGDRHLQNILIDLDTAEVVHIDLGIGFDLGRTLPTPETIPFRLTQDIVAGFGSSGVQGIFRRSCEKTMQLLRDNQETLLTILEVLLHDPLYSWTVTCNLQNVVNDVNQTSESDGSLAERAILAVRSKLSGMEGGVAGGVSVPGLVALLVQQAMDPVNLSRLYPGWQPYL